jgi:diguanylate cyclase (GGDEF)-like protein
MVIDIQTLLLANGVVVAIAGFSFILNTVLRGSDDVGRTWSIAFISGILTGLSYTVSSAVPSAWWAVAAGNGALVLSIGAMWSGARQFNDRKGLLWVPVGVGMLVALAALVRGPSGGEWAGAVEMFVAAGALSILAGAETLRGRLIRTSNARALTVVFWGLGVYYVLRTIVIIYDSPTGDVFTRYWGTATTTIVTIVFVILASISMSVLTATRRSRAEAFLPGSGEPAIPGVLNKKQFEQAARDWLARARRDHDALVLVYLDVANLDHMNTAFGRTYGDQAIFAVGRVAAEHSPSAAIIGHSGGKRFAILTTMPPVGNAVAVAERIHTALVESPIDPVEGIRAIATCGLGLTETDGYDFGDLQRATLRALERASEAGPGTILVAGA